MTHPLRVTQIVGSEGPGGAEAFFVRLARALHEAGPKAVEQQVIVREGSWIAQRLRELAVPHHTARFGGLLDFATRPAITKLLADFQPDVVQTWMNRASRFTPRTGVPTVGRLGGYYKLKYYKNCDHLIGNTQDICAYIRKSGWAEDKVSYVPNFVDLPPEGFGDYRLDVREAYGIDPNVRLLLLAARLHENKGIDIALYALSKLPDNVHLLIAGTGPEEENLRASVEADDLGHRVHFAGWVNQMTPLFAAADIFIVPSRIEPLGNVVLEAWAHQLPVVATATPGPKSLIQEGRNGLLVPVEDEKALARAVETLLNDPASAQRMAEAVQREVRRHFAQSAVVEEYLRLYRKLAGRED
jgi:glycosyltransferase involved in cell wall biosynthesis